MVGDMGELVGEVLEAQLAVLLELVEQVLLVLPILEDLVVVVEALVAFFEQGVVVVVTIIELVQGIAVGGDSVVKGVLGGEVVHV